MKKLNIPKEMSQYFGNSYPAFSGFKYLPSFSLANQRPIRTNRKHEGVDDAPPEFYSLSGKRFCRLVGLGQVLFYLTFLTFMAECL